MIDQISASQLSEFLVRIEAELEHIRACVVAADVAETNCNVPGIDEGSRLVWENYLERRAAVTLPDE